MDMQKSLRVWAPSSSAAASYCSFVSHVDTPSLSYAPCVNQSWRKNPQSHPKIFPYARDEQTKSEKKKNFSPRTPFLFPARTSPSRSHCSFRLPLSNEFSHAHIA